MTAPRPRPRVELPDRALLTPSEVATAFAVDPKTVTRWGRAGTLHSVRTPALGDGAGHRRYFRSEVDALLNGPEAGK